MSFDQPHRDSEAEMKAWAETLAAAEIFDNRPGTHEQLVAAIGTLIDAKVAAALEEYSYRLREAYGVRP